MTEKLLSSYDFPAFVNNSRAIQLLCTVIQLLFVYTESASLSFLTFLLYSVLVGVHSLHIARRWYYNIDGRYDVRQIIRDNELTIKIQYAVAIFSPLVLGVLSWTFIELNNGLVHYLFHCTCFVQIMCAFLQLGFEFYEVIVGNNKKTF